MCEQIFKKKTAPQNNSNSLNCRKHSRRTIHVQLKEFSLTKQKVDLDWIMSELGKLFPNKSDKKI